MLYKNIYINQITVGETYSEEIEVIQINLNYNSLALDLENLRDLYNRQNYLIAIYDSENRELKEKIKELEQRND